MSCSFFRNFFVFFSYRLLLPSCGVSISRGLRELLKGLKVGMVRLFMKFCVYWKRYGDPHY